MLTPHKMARLDEDPALGMAGLERSGKGDLARRHDSYSAELEGEGHNVAD